MRIYIAYKYTNITNKTELRLLLEQIGNILKDMGHNTFILNRDAQSWGRKHISLWKNVFTILNNLKKSDIILAIVNSDVKSKGLNFEIMFAKLFGKKIVCAKEKNIKNSNMKICKNTFEFEDIKDFEKKIKKALNS